MARFFPQQLSQQTHSLFVVVFLSLILFALPDYSSAQNAWLDEETYLTTFDVLTFNAGDGKHAFVEAFCHISTGNLQFVKSKTRFFASFRVVVSVRDVNAEVVASRQFIDSVWVDSFYDIDDPRPVRVVRFTFLLEPGLYDIQMQVEDQETSRRLTVRRKMHVPDYAGVQPTMSDIQLATSIKVAREENMLVKFGREIVPNIAHVVGLESDSVFAYCELYHLNGFTSSQQPGLVVTYSILDRNGRVVKSAFSLCHELAQEVSVASGFFTGDLDEGAYQMTVSVTAPAGTILLQRATPFLLIRPEVDPGRVTQLLLRRFGKEAFF
ncbi:MAG: hypothetical protein ACE5IY_01910 [bacterium]